MTTTTTTTAKAKKNKGGRPRKPERLSEVTIPEMLDVAIGRLQENNLERLSRIAFETLEELMTDDTQRGSVRVAAARAIISAHNEEKATQRDTAAATGRYVGKKALAQQAALTAGHGSEWEGDLILIEASEDAE